ncbi:hypothetical protein [Microcoleus sp. MON1_C5]
MVRLDTGSDRTVKVMYLRSLLGNQKRVTKFASSQRRRASALA